MPFTDLQELLRAVEGFIITEAGKRVFSMPSDALGSQSIAALVNHYFVLQQGRWVLNAPTAPAISNDAVVLSAQSPLLLGMASALIDLSFDLADNGAPSLLVTLAPLDPRQPLPIANWNLGNAFPVWAEYRSPLTRLNFDAPRFDFSSIDSAGIPSGLSFAANALKFDGILAPLSLIPHLEFKTLSGVIVGDSDAPHMTLASAPVQPIPIQYLNLPFTFSAISTDPDESGRIQLPPPPVATFLQLSSSIEIGNSNVPPIPIRVRFGGLGSTIILGADLRAISSYALSEFDNFVHQAQIATYLDSVFHIGETVELTDLSVAVDLSPVQISGVSLGLHTKRPLTVVSGYVEIPEISVVFMVNDPAGSRDITAILSGRFVFLEDIPISVSAIFPQMLFAGGLDLEQPLPLATIVKKFVPSVQGFPGIYLNQLTVTADLTAKRYSFQLVVSSEWQIPIGIARFQMQEASLGLTYTSGDSRGFSGEISAVAVLFSQSDNEIARFFAAWTLPGNFLISGTFPEISLTDLAVSLTGGAVPNAAGLPQITLRNSIVEFQYTQGTTRLARLGANTGSGYRFSLRTTIDVEKIGQANLFFEVRKGTANSAPSAALSLARQCWTASAANDSSATGFVAGLVLTPDWKPDQVWNGLADVFSLMTVKDAGLILSSISDDVFNLPNLQMSYVPPSIKPGITFFAALELSGNVFGQLKQLFSSSIEFDLSAYINPANFAESEIVASLPGDDGKGAISFTGVSIAITPGKGEFSLTAGAIVAFEGERLTLEGAGILRVTPPVVTFVIRITNWKKPFGIEGLTVLAFGLSISAGSSGVTIGLLGYFLIGQDASDQFKFKVGGGFVDFEAPSALVFGLESGSGRPLKVTDLILQFTSIDLSSMPLLNALAFVTLSFYVVADPNGWLAPDKHFYAFGIGIDADLLFYSWELKLFMEVNYNRGVLADGSINEPIKIADLLKISDTSGDKGPSMHIDTTPLSAFAPSVMTRLDEQLLRTMRALPDDAVPAVFGINPFAVRTTGDASKVYFAASGAVYLLGLSANFSGSVTDGGFEVNFSANLAHLFNAGFMASLSKTNGFQGRAEGHFDFSLDLPGGLVIHGIPLLPPVRITGPNALLKIECVLSTSEARVELVLDFRWGSIHFNPTIRIDAKQVQTVLAALWDFIVNWIKEHLEEFFSGLLNNVEKYIEALASGFLWFGQTAVDVARVLFDVFKIGDVKRVAELLIEIGRFAFNALVDALVSVFNLSFEAAVKVLEALGEICAMATNEAVLYGAAQGRQELN
jgi:hypothetical protein